VQLRLATTARAGRHHKLPPPVAFASLRARFAAISMIST
jgi:hypothetical protein